MGLFNKRRYGSRQGGEIDPDEIFLDSHNLPEFDNQQFEGRIEKPITKRTIYSLGIFFILVILVFGGKLFKLQILEGNSFLDKGENNRLKHSIIFSERGIIYDRNKNELAWNTVNGDLSAQVGSERFSKRNYIDLSGLAHTLGFIGYPLMDNSGNYYETESVGKDGVEKLFNLELAGENGLKIVEVDALMRKKSEFVIKPPVDGENINLSIDVQLQNYFFDSIRNLAKDVGFKGGAGVIMDVNNGEILAITSYPEFNSDILSNSKDRAEILKYTRNNNNPFLNRATSGLYIPGSIIKPMMALAALQENIITPEKEILSTGSISIQNPYFPELKTVFKDWKAHGWVDMRRAIAVSSDVYFYAIGGGYEDQKGLGITKINKYMRMFGFGSETGGDVVSEASGVVPNPDWKMEVFGEDWYVGNTYHTSIGQYGFQVTPLQVVKAVAAIANNGILLKPIIIKNSQENKDAVSEMPFTDEYFKIVKEGMRDGVTEGTAQGLNVPFVKIAAKTGTAELGVSKKYVNSWVTGFFPYKNPKYAFTVVMEQGPKDNQIGGLYIMRQMLEWMNVNAHEYLEN